LMVSRHDSLEYALSQPKVPWPDFTHIHTHSSHR